MSPRKFYVSAICLILLSFTCNVPAAEPELSFKEYIEKANNYISAHRHFEASDALKQATRLGGEKHPSLHMRLGILYYGLGLISEAISEGEQAVRLAPHSKWYKYDLAKFYFVDKQYDKAEKQLKRLLQLDPGFTLGYYYLAELYYHQKRYGLAWLSLNRAKLLGHQGKSLERRLEAVSRGLEEKFAKSGSASKLFRFIRVDTAASAEEVLAQIRQGKLFEVLELELKNDDSGNAEFGVMMLDELKDSVAASLQDSALYGFPQIIRTGPDYRIMQRIAPFNPEEWQQMITGSTVVEDAEEPATATDQTTALVQSSEPPTESTIDSQTEPVIAEQAAPEEPSIIGDENQFSSKLAAYYALENWKNKWAAQDVSGYLAAYSDHFQPPPDLSLATWKEKRRASLTRPEYIKLDIADPVVELLDTRQLLITFKQSYTSNTYNDIVIKTLTMEKEDEGWKIVEERVVKQLHP